MMPCPPPKPPQSNRSHLVVMQGDGIGLDKAIAKPEWRTPNLGGPLGAKAFGERVAKVVAEIAR